MNCTALLSSYVCTLLEKAQANSKFRKSTCCDSIFTHFIVESTHYFYLSEIPFCINSSNLIFLFIALFQDSSFSFILPFPLPFLPFCNLHFSIVMRVPISVFLFLLDISLCLYLHYFLLFIFSLYLFLSPQFSPVSLHF